MTTPANPVRPERMADADLAACAERVGLAAEHGEAASPDDAHALADEAIRARAEESRLSRELMLADRLADALASELGTLVCQVMEADRERDAAREEAERLRLMLHGTPETCATAACDKPSVRGGYCFDCYHSDE